MAQALRKGQGQTGVMTPSVNNSPNETQCILPLLLSPFALCGNACKAMAPYRDVCCRFNEFLEPFC